MKSLDSFFRPRSVAFIGASADGSKLGGRRFRTLVEEGFEGRIFAVNPRVKEVRGIPSFASVRDVAEPIDLAVIVVRSDLVPGTVDDCLDRGVRAIVLISAGFGEVSEEGRGIEQAMARRCAEVGARLVGPNCAGLFDAAANLNVGGLDVPRGPIGIASQSGNLVLDFAAHARTSGLGFSRYAAIGNAADVRTIDVVESLLDDAATRVVLAYQEGFAPGEGRRLFDLVRAHPARKPVVILKPGRTSAGRAAALSHTGSLAGEDRIVDAAFRQAGIHRAADAGEAWDVACALARYAPIAGDGVAILSDGGGHATVLADALGAEGLTVPALDAGTRDALAAFLPARCALGNPVDFAGVVEEDPSQWVPAARVCAAAPGIAAIAMVGHFGGYHCIGGEVMAPLEAAAAKSLAELARGLPAPVLVHSIHADRGFEALNLLRDGGVTVARSPARIARALAALRFEATARAGVTPEHDAGVPLSSAPGSTPVRPPGALAEPEARDYLTGRGFEIPAHQVSADPDALAAVCAAAGPQALKLIAPGLVHRSDAGAVLLGVDGEADIAASARALLDAARADARPDARVMAAAMIDGGVECAFGLVRDPHFGPVVMFGLGGIHLEVLDDVVFRLAPIGEAEAFAMIDAIRGRKLLDGHRGEAAVDRGAAARLLVLLGRLGVSDPAVAEVDLNPVFLRPDGAAIADVRVVFGSVPYPRSTKARRAVSMSPPE